MLALSPSTIDSIWYSGSGMSRGTVQSSSSAMQGENSGVMEDGPYYAPYPEEAST